MSMSSSMGTDWTRPSTSVTPLGSRLSSRRPSRSPWPRLCSRASCASSPIRRSFARRRQCPQRWPFAARLSNGLEPFLLLRAARIGIFLRTCAPQSRALVSDAYVAALAIEHGCELITTASDFARFPNFRWRHPLGRRTHSARNYVYRSLRPHLHLSRPKGLQKCRGF